MNLKFEGNQVTFFFNLHQQYFFLQCSIVIVLGYIILCACYYYII